MMNKMTTFVLAMMTAQTLSAQEVLTTQQDSLLQVMNDTAYWKSFELGEVVVKSNLPKTRVTGDAMRTTISGSSALRPTTSAVFGSALKKRRILIESELPAEEFTFGDFTLKFLNTKTPEELAGKGENANQHRNEGYTTQKIRCI